MLNKFPIAYCVTNDQKVTMVTKIPEMANKANIFFLNSSLALCHHSMQISVISPGRDEAIDGLRASVREKKNSNEKI